MSTDFTALAVALAGGLPDVRACLLVSRDGLVLGSHPPEEEARTVGVWSRIAALGDVERGFCVVGEEVWSFSRRGPYVGLAVASGAARAGVILDRLDQMLLVAEEARTRREAVRPTQKDPIEAPRGPRTSLHGDVKVNDDARDPATGPAAQEPRSPAAREAQSPRPAPSPAATAQPAPTPARAPAPAEPEPPARPGLDVDPIALAREFHGLLSDVEEEPNRGKG